MFTWIGSLWESFLRLPIFHSCDICELKKIFFNPEVVELFHYWQLPKDWRMGKMEGDGSEAHVFKLCAKCARRHFFKVAAKKVIEEIKQGR